MRIHLALLAVGLLALPGCRESAPPAPKRTVLTPNPGDYTEVQYSPDGKRMAFVASNADKYAVWTAAIDGSEAKQVSPAATWVRGPEWSPDGQAIAFGSAAAAPPDVWVVPATGGEARRLTSDPGLEFNQHWSHDGNRILYSANRLGHFDLFTVSPQGGAFDTILVDGANKFAEWSPDGNRLAVQRNDGARSTIEILTLDAHASRPLTTEGPGDVRRVVTGRSPDPLPVQPDRDLGRLDHAGGQRHAETAHPGHPQRLGSEVLARWALGGVPVRSRWPAGRLDRPDGGR